MIRQRILKKQKWYMQTNDRQPYCLYNVMNFYRRNIPVIFLGVFFILLLHNFSVAQNYVTISGIVQDNDSSEPLIFASIGVRGLSIGTISNTVGEFDFHVPTEHSDKILEINMLGYESFRMEISEIIMNDVSVFKLVRSTQFLDEVIVTDSLKGGDILSIALDLIEDNYPTRPFMMDGFYRDVKNIGGTYVALLEAAVKIFDKGYDEPRNKYRLREKVALIEVRKSLGYDHKFTSFFDQTNLLEDLLLHNTVRYRQFPENENFFNALIRTATNFYNGRRVFVVELQSLTTLKLYIDAVTYGIIRLEYKTGPGEDIIDRKRNMESKLHSLYKIMEFREYAGKLFLSHINLISEINWYKENTDIVEFNTILHQQLLINKVYPNPVDKIEATEKMRRFGLQYQHKNYNNVFWDNYNVIKETPLNREIIDDLEKELSLDKQFQDN